MSVAHIDNKISQNLNDYKNDLIDLLVKQKIDGNEFGERLSNKTDSAITALAQEYLGDFLDQISIIALGGNGRKDISLQSDLDLLTLLPEKLSNNIAILATFQQKRLMLGQNPDIKQITNFTEAESKHIENNKDMEDAIEFSQSYSSFSAAISSLNFSSASVVPRSILETKEGAIEDQTIWTAHLDRRFICGNNLLATELEQVFDTLRQDADLKEKYIQEKFEERSIRLSKEAGTPLAPNIKDGVGGLRDYQSSLWIANVMWNTKTPEEIKDKGLFSANELQGAYDSYKALLTFRSRLHNILGGKNERIISEIQPDLAEDMGYNGVPEMMHDYFNHTRTLAFFANVTEAMAREEFDNNILIETKPISSFQVTGSHIKFQDNNVPDPIDMLSIYKVAQEENVKLHHTALRYIRDNAERIREYKKDNTANAEFLSILTSKNGSGQALRQMQEIGLLQEFFLPFKNIDVQMQFDPYHAYTVDEHTFTCIEMMSALENGKLESEAPLASKLFKKGMGSSQRQVLYTAMLMHDIGKGQGGDHAEIGVDIAKEYCPQLGLNTEETETVCWLIKNHLLFTDRALHRDPDDPKTVDNFTTIVDTPEKLKLLEILTTSDTMGVKPGCWTPNNEACVATLYYKAHAQLHNQKLALTPKFTLSSENYIAGKTEVSLKPNGWGGATIIIITPDKSFLLENVTGALGKQDIRSISVDTITDQEGNSVAIQKHSISPAVHINPEYEEEYFARIKERIEKAITYDEAHSFPDGDFNLLRPGQKGKNAYPIKPKVICNNTASYGSTVIEITARNKLGLIHDIANILGQHDLKVNRAFIATKGHKAINSFYVSDRETNQKIEDPEIIDEIKQTIEELIQEPNKTQQNDNAPDPDIHSL